MENFKYIYCKIGQGAATFMQSRIRVAFMSQCDMAIRSQMCRSATFISKSHLCRIAMSRLYRSCVTWRLSYELLKCDVAFRSQMCRSAMSYCDLFATYLRYRRWVAFRSQCDIHFGDIAATYISYWVGTGYLSHHSVYTKSLVGIGQNSDMKQTSFMHQ